MQPKSLFPGRNIPSIPPLRTPSPHEPRTAIPVFDSASTKITPTEPLQPRKGEPLPEFESPQFQRVQTYGTATSSPMKDSPLKENDVLSDEILRTLSPSGPEAKLGDIPEEDSLVRSIRSSMSLYVKFYNSAHRVRHRRRSRSRRPGWDS